MTIALMEKKSNLGSVNESEINYEYFASQHNYYVVEDEYDIIEEDYFPELLDITDEKELIEYEKKLYNSYSKDKEGWMYNNYEIIDNCRMRPPISYDDQLIYVVKRREDNEIVAGVTVHINSCNKFIVEKMGFNIYKTPQTCEGITLFINDEEIFNCGIIMEILNNFIDNDIISRGYDKIYGSTNKRHVKFHKNKKSFKLNDIEYKKVGKEIRSLLFRKVSDEEIIEVYKKEKEYALKWT